MTAVPGVDHLKTEIGAGTALEQLAAASDLSQKLRARGDELLDEFVDAARTSGASWSEIGCSLGTSKQAAQQRFGALADSPPDQAPAGLVGPAVEVLSAAGDEARALGHHYIRPEHIVLGLLSQSEELAARALADVGLNATGVRAQVITQLGSSAPRPTGSLGIAPQTKRLLELSRAIAKSLRHNCPRTEHMLLAAVSPKLHGPAARLLAECGTPPDQVRDHLTQMIVQQAPELADRLTNRSLLSRVKSRGV